MYVAIKDDKIIAINKTSGSFPCLVYDKVQRMKYEELVQIDGEYVSQSDERVQAKLRTDRIAELKQQLADSDYWGQKYLDGEYTDEEWQEKVSQRKSWREEIRQLESQNSVNSDK